jgi:hypothetical protein
MSTDTLTPVEHDTELLRLLAQSNVHFSFIRLYTDSPSYMLGKELGDTKWTDRGWGRSPSTDQQYRFSVDNISTLRAVCVRSDNEVDYFDLGWLHGAQHWLSHFDSFVDTQRMIAELEKGYTGWSRYFLVVSSAGLIHDSMDCHTCNKGRKPTEFALLPELSGTDHTTAVAALGPSLCSVCYPSAPVEWTDTERIPARIAEVLLKKGPEAFHAELAKYKAKKAAKESAA